MSLSVAQNRFRFVRVHDEYGTWQDSPVSGNSVHGFVPLRAPLDCQGCHMPVRDGRTVHGCAAEATAAPGRPGITLDLFSARTTSQQSQRGEVEAAPLDSTGLLHQAGQSILLSVVVTNTGVGHEFPAGKSLLRDTWLELEIRDGSRAGMPRLFRSGALDSRGEPDPHAHRYGLAGLDRSGQRVDRGELDALVAPLYPEDPTAQRSAERARRPRSLRPGEAEVVRYRFTPPHRARGPLRIHARLKERSRTSVTHVPGLARTAGTPAPEVRVVATATATLRLEGEGRRQDRMGPDSVPRRQPGPGAVEGGEEPAPGASPGRGGASTPGPAAVTIADRWYRYGVGLLLQGDLPRAAAAMRQVQAIETDSGRGFVGLGRVYLEVGDLLAAQAQFEAALRRNRGDPQARAMLGAVYRRRGDYAAAISLLFRLTREHPRDRRLHFELAMAQFRSGRYADAERSFRQVLAIDPDEVAAHHSLMLCLQRLNRTAEARREEVVYQTLREHESVRQVIGQYLRRNPAVERELRTLHEHVLR